LADLPRWSAEENRWRLLNRDDFIRDLSLPRLWGSLTLETIAAPDSFFSPELTAAEALGELLAAERDSVWIRPADGNSSRLVRLSQLLDPGARRRTLRELAQEDFPTLTPGRTYQDAQNLMRERNVDFVRVIDSAGAEQGWLTPLDFLAALAPERLTAWLAQAPPRKRASAETGLEQSQERLRYLLSASPAVIYALRPQAPFDCLYMSPNAVKLLGYTPSELLRAPGQWQERIASDYREEWSKELDNLSHQGRSCLEYPWSHPQGRVLWLRDERRLLKNAQGEPQEIVGSLLDISASKRAELARELNEAHLETIVSNVAEGIVILDRQQKVIFANAQASQMFSLPKQDLLGSSLNLSQLGDAKGEIEIWQGEQVGVGEIQSQSILWDAQPAQLVSIRNITARKLDAERARLSELRHQTLMETVPNIVWVLDGAGELQEINQSALNYLGLARSQIQLRLWRDIIHPEDQERARRDWQRSNFELRAGKAEYRFRRRDGVYRWHLVQATPLQPEAQGQFLWLGSCTDIEDLKQAEIQLRQRKRSRGSSTAY
jgi:PAS domain S-box-containing protein